jgi:hypothetical protein
MVVRLTTTNRRPLPALSPARRTHVEIALQPREERTISIRRNLLALALSAAALTLWAAPASAAQTRVVSPTSTRAVSPCTTETPCRLDYAMGVSVSGDDVAVLPGDYYASGTTPWATLPRLPAYTSIHGVAGAPIPVIHGHVVETSSFLLLDGATARDLAVEMDTSGIYLLVSGLHLVNGATAERVQVRATNRATDSVLSPCRIEDGKLSDSICAGDGTLGQVPALYVGTTTSSAATTSATVRNVTAVSTARSGNGIKVTTYTGTSALTATNVIAEGRDADIAINAPYGSGMAKLVIDHSNWDTIVGTGAGTQRFLPGNGNQTGSTGATPLFVDRGAGDYRQAPGSPTIDAGAPTGNSVLDFAGDPRVSGASVDIGADEFFPPPLATTGAATGVRERAVTLNGTVDPRGDAAGVRFEYGPTTAYGSTSGAPDVPAPATASPVTATLTGLRPATTYHYRVVATTARGGAAAGADRTFRTDDEAGDGNGPGTGGRSDATVEISALRVGKRWRLRRPARRRDKTPVGTTISFSLSKDATATVEFARLRPGRRTSRGRLTVKARRGKNSVRFRGRLRRGATLTPGRYLLTVRAAGSDGKTSAPRSARFTIVR